MEYANNGDLHQKIVEQLKKGQLFQEHEIWSIFIQVKNKENIKELKKLKKVVKGLNILHKLKIFHRDLKVNHNNI